MALRSNRAILTAALLALGLGLSGCEGLDMVAKTPRMVEMDYALSNGFGFGGTNSHLILEEFHPAFHAKLCAAVPPKCMI